MGNEAVGNYKKAEKTGEVMKTKMRDIKCDVGSQREKGGGPLVMKSQRRVSMRAITQEGRRGEPQVVPVRVTLDCHA